MRCACPLTVGRGARGCDVAVGLAEPLDLERVRELEEVVEVGLLHLDLALVHEEEEVAHDLLVGVLEDDDRMLLGQVLEELVEVLRARGQDHPVGGDSLAVGAGQGHVDQGVGVQELLEGAQRVERVVVPLEVELLGSLHLSSFCFVFFSDFETQFILLERIPI